MDGEQEVRSAMQLELLAITKRMSLGRLRSLLVLAKVSVAGECPNEEELETTAA